MDAAPSPRILRHSPGTVDGLAHNAAHRLATQHALVHYATGAIFTFIPKNACTSLRVSLAMANGVIAAPEEWTWVHNNNATFSATLADLARAPISVVILRCPFRRLASAFLDKIVSRMPEFWTLHRKSRDMIDPDRLTFRGFVEWIGKPGFLRADLHWRPQVDFLVYRQYDKVFAFERLSDFDAFFADVTGQSFVDARPLSGHATSVTAPLTGDGFADMPLAELAWMKFQGQLPRPIDLYDAALVATVRRLYADDIALYHDLFGKADLLFPPPMPEDRP